MVYLKSGVNGRAILVNSGDNYFPQNARCIALKFNSVKDDYMPSDPDGFLCRKSSHSYSQFSWHALNC